MSRNTFLYIFICAIVSCMSACDKNAHEKELYGISVRLTFDDELDASQTKVKNGSLWIYQVDGKLVKEYFYEGAKDLSSQCFDLPAGNYVVVSALNFNSPLTYKNQNEMQALAFYTSAPDPLSEHAFYSTVQVEVRENENHTRYFIGVPGMYSNRDRFMASMFGFDNFKKSHRSDFSNPYFGYWYQEF